MNQDWSLLGLAPDGGCPAAALLLTPVVSYTTISPLPAVHQCTAWAVSFCGPLPMDYSTPGVTRHLAIWSADFPQPGSCRIAVIRPTWNSIIPSFDPRVNINPRRQVTYTGMPADCPNQPPVMGGKKSITSLSLHTVFIPSGSAITSTWLSPI